MPVCGTLELSNSKILKEGGEKAVKKCLLTFILIFALIFSSTTLCFGAADQDVTIVNPVSNSSVTSSSLLISVKIAQPKTISVSVFEIKKKVGDGSVSLGESDMKAILEGTYADSGSLGYDPIVTGESFTSTNKLSFYTKKLENRNPGVYLIKVDTISQNKAVYTSRSYVTIKSKSAEDSKLFDSSQSGTAAFLQNLIKAIFN